MADPSNPFDGNDDLNPFGTEIESYDPFQGQGSTQTPSTDLQFDDSFYDNTYQPSGDMIDQPITDEEIPTGSTDPNAQPADVQIPLDIQEVHGEAEEENKEDYSFFQLGYYKQMFNVDTTDVADRVFRATVPFRKNFVSEIKKNPDLYGPFWISATLIFILASAGNFANYLYYWINNMLPLWVYDFNRLPIGAAVIFAYVAVVPFILWAVVSWLDDFELSLLQCLCLYGYAMFIFIIAGIVSPINAVSCWVAFCLACAISAGHIILSLYEPLKSNLKIYIIASIAIFLFHFGLTLSFILYFFAYTDPTVQITIPVTPPA